MKSIITFHSTPLTDKEIDKFKEFIKKVQEDFFNTTRIPVINFGDNKAEFITLSNNQCEICGTTYKTNSELMEHHIKIHKQ